MKNIDLSKIAISLASEIDIISENYHVKSDEFEILIWEADILRAKAKDLVENCGLNENLTNSTLISKWGISLANKIPKTAQRVQVFHEQYNCIKST